MATPENIFALQLGEPQPQQVIPVTGVPWDSGLRAILSVQTIVAKLQTTVLFGNSLYMISYDVGQFSRADGYKYFLQKYFGKELTGVQLSAPPFAATPYLYIMTGLPVPPPPTPIATGTVKILNAGFDPFRGYWIEFHGNYYLHFPLFKNWPDVIRDTPNYKGYQPNTSGGQGGGPGSGGNNGGPSGGSGICM
jgi:uncharacterized membrane protein YgcG